MVFDRDHMYERNGEDSRVLAVVGAFRVVPEHELGSDREDISGRDAIDHLRDEGLIRTSALEHDIAAYGESIEQAKRAFERTVQGYFQLAAKYQQEPLASLH